MARKAEIECSAEKLGALVEQYFAECEENSRKPTAPGLCFALGISVSKFLKIIGSDGEYRRRGHARVLEMAQLRLIDDIEQRTDSMSVSRSKLPVYSIGRDLKQGGVTVKIELGGMKKGDEPFE